MILCIGSIADDTFFHTLAAFKRAKIQITILDVAQLALSGGIQYSLKDLNHTIINLHDSHYSLCNYQGVWIRLIEISEAAPNIILKQKIDGLYHALKLLFSNVVMPIINPPLKDQSNFSKLYHAIALSKQTNWSIPRSCLTNNKSIALKFIDECRGNVIFKGASGMKTLATLYKKETHENRLSLIQSTPVLFQERIDGPDVRVHVVGKKLFAEIIESSEVDYRFANNNKFQNIKLPDGIAKSCLQLSEYCKTPFLGIDFKIQRSSSEWFFLEANSMPCYQGYDRRANGVISQAIVEWLTGKQIL